MVTSLYTKGYFDSLRIWYEEQGYEFDNYNEHIQTLYYTPRGQSIHMIDYLVRKALTESTKKQGEDFIYLGWNRGVVRALDGTRNHPLKVALHEKGWGLQRTMRKLQYQLSSFIITNSGNIAEDFEELHEALIQPKCESEADMSSLLISDFPDFRFNIIHSNMIRSEPLLEHGNLWGLHWNATIIGPGYAMREDRLEFVKSLSVALYQENNLIDVLKFSKGEEDGS